MGSALALIYSAAGNQTELPLCSFTYDAENRLIGASERDMAAISYVYDGEGKRVQMTVGTSVTTTDGAQTYPDHHRASIPLLRTLDCPKDTDRDARQSA